MPRENCRTLLQNRWDQGFHLCFGLDTDPAIIRSYIPSGDEAYRILRFNYEIIDAVADVAAAFKPNYAFYFSQGLPGLQALLGTIRYIHEMYPDIPVILDGKFNDIGNTMEQYVQGAYDYYDADGATFSPYMGREDSLDVALSRKDRMAFILCRTSNKGGSDLQTEELSKGATVFEHIAELAVNRWNENGNCGLVFGANYLKELTRGREIASEIPVLLPGLGVQGATVQDIVGVAGRNFIANTSRGVIYAAKDPTYASAAGKKARSEHEALTQAMATATA